MENYLTTFCKHKSLRMEEKAKTDLQYLCDCQICRKWLWKYYSYIFDDNTRTTERWQIPLSEKCPCLELFWYVFSLICTEYGEILRISPYSVQIRKNTDQNNSDYVHFLRSVLDSGCMLKLNCVFGKRLFSLLFVFFKFKVLGFLLLARKKNVLITMAIKA